MAEPPFPGARLVATAAAVNRAWDELAASLQPLVATRPCVLLGVLLGGVVPLVQISGRLRGDFLLDYCHLTRYAGATRGGALRWVQPPRLPLQGATVIVIDDIFDEGDTLRELHAACRERGAAAVHAAVLVRKRHGRAVAGPVPDFVGLEIGDEYVFGCGMDYQERWRHLAELWALPGATGGVPCDASG